MKLHRALGLKEVFCIASGAMISSGLFVLPALAFAEVGPGVIAAYALAAVMMVPAMLSQAELSTAMPRSGGSYFFIERSMGGLVGTLAGLAGWVALALKSAFAMVGIGAFAVLLVPELPPGAARPIAAAACVAMGLLNALSVKGSGRFQVAMVLGLLTILGGFCLVGLLSIDTAGLPRRLEGFGAAGATGILATAGLVFVSYGGLTKVAAVAEEVTDPGRTLIRGMVAAAVVVSLLYVLAVFVVVATLDVTDLTGLRRLAPLSIAAERFAGPVGFVVLTVGAILAFVSTGNSGLLTASRVPMAMGRDGLLPDALGRVSRRLRTPLTSISLTTAAMVVCVLLLPLAMLVKVASTMLLMLFVLVNLAVIIMRTSGIQNYRPPYRSPLYPYVQIAGVLLYGVLIVGMGLLSLATTAVFAAVGSAWFLLYARRHTDRRSALVHAVHNIAGREIARSNLDEELREIAIERDNIVHDRFDRLVRDGPILDLPDAMLAGAFFERVGEVLGPRVGLEPATLAGKFRKREEQTSSVLQPGLAIPHVVVQGKGVFELLLVRCKGGVVFPGVNTPVNTAFVLAASEDQRNFHLRALMAIAHVVQEHAFTRRWMEARDAEQLRDIVLLSGRKRQHEA